MMDEETTKQQALHDIARLPKTVHVPIYDSNRLIVWLYVRQPDAAARHSYWLGFLRTADENTFAHNIRRGIRYLDIYYQKQYGCHVKHLKHKHKKLNISAFRLGEPAYI